MAEQTGSGTGSAVPDPSAWPDEQQPRSDHAKQLVEFALAAARRAPKTSPGRPAASPRGELLLARALRLSEVPEQYREASWSKCSVEVDLRRYCWNVSRHLAKGTGLLMMGPVGTGKSSAAALVLREAAKQQHSIRWSYVPTLVDRLADTKMRVQEQHRQVGVEFLVWDDFGVRDFADWEIERLDAIVEERYSRRRPMLITTNWDRDRLQADPRFRRLLDRWRQRTQRLLLVGESQRRPEPVETQAEMSLLDGTDG